MTSFDGQSDGFGGNGEGFTADEEIIMLEIRGDEVPRGFDRIAEEGELGSGSVEDLSRRDRKKIRALMDLLGPDDRALVEECYGTPFSNISQ